MEVKARGVQISDISCLSQKRTYWFIMRNTDWFGVYENGIEVNATVGRCG